MPDRRLKIVVLVNTLAPSRVPIYAALAAQFQLLVLHGGKESNRDSWTNLEKALPNATVVKAWGWQIPFKRKQKGQVFDNLYLHVTPGYIWHLLKFRPEALITNEMGLRTMIALAYGTLFRKPVWVWWGGTCHTESKIGTLKKITRRFVSAWASRWISYGQTSTEYLQTLGVHRDRILQIQNAVDERPFLGNTLPSRTRHVRPLLLCVGQLIARKGIDLLLNAVATVQNRGRDPFPVGTARYKFFWDCVSELNLKNVFSSQPLRKKWNAVYRNADTLIFPTLEDPWGLVVNEAMLSGLPVLCSKYAGCAEELLPATNIFDPDNRDQFAQKLEQAIDGQIAPARSNAPEENLEVSDDLICDVKRASPASRRGATRKLPSNCRSVSLIYEQNDRALANRNPHQALPMSLTLCSAVCCPSRRRLPHRHLQIPRRLRRRRRLLRNLRLSHQLRDIRRHQRLTLLSLLLLRTPRPPHRPRAPRNALRHLDPRLHLPLAGRNRGLREIALLRRFLPIQFLFLESVRLFRFARRSETSSPQLRSLLPSKNSSTFYSRSSSS